MVNPNLFSESYQQIRENSFQYGTEKRLSIQTENGVSTWHRGILGLPRFVDQDVIDQLGTTISAPLIITQEVAEFARATLTIIEQLATLIIDPVYFITEAVLDVLREFINSILNAKFSYIFHHSTVDDLKPITTLLGDIGDSVLDKSDYHRPIADVLPLVSSIDGTPESDDFIYSPNGASVYMAFVVFACPGVQSVYALMQILQEFIKVPNFNVPDFSLEVQPRTSGEPAYDFRSPNWSGYNLSDVVPVVKNIAVGIDSLIDLVAESRSSLIEMIQESIAVLAQKIQQLESISAYLQNIIEAIIRLLQFGPLIIYTVEGTYTPTELKQAINAGIESAPFGLDDVGLILGLSVTAPLIDVENQVDQVGDTVSAFETQKDIIKQILGLN